MGNTSAFDPESTGKANRSAGQTTMRSFLRVSVIGIALLAVVVGAAAWYSLALPGRSHTGALAPMTGDEREIAGRLRRHVVAVASVPHNVAHYAALEQSARYIEQTLENLGYSIERQTFSTEGQAVRNIEVTRKSGSAGAPSLVIGAHYDSFRDSPGANDNGTGVAAVLELARLLKDWQPNALDIRFVLFVNEEPPYYRTADMGSWRYAKRLSEQGAPIYGMISLETLGAFYDQADTQHYPPPFGLVFPTTANFIAMVGMTGSRTFLHKVVGSFRSHTAFPTIGGVASDALVPGIGWSDHWSFAGFNFPAIMITDTALFRYRHYHRPSDTPDKVDYDKLARITKGIERVIRSLAAATSRPG
jgi:Zn-dependent M28 family amino/carboxypeptidase